MVITSGFPKSGNHALVKSVQLLGQPCSVEHIPYTESIGKHIFIKRDPRNVICSWLRFNGNPVTPGMFITSFRLFQYTDFVTELKEYEGWLHDEQTLVVSFEKLLASDAEIKRIAEYLQIPYINGAFEDIEGLTSTWFKDHSDWKQIWTPEVDQVWTDGDGPTLLNRWGY